MHEPTGWQLFHRKRHGQKFPNDCHIGNSVQAQTAGRKRTVPAQGHIQQDLVCQMGFHRQVGFVMQEDLFNNFPGYGFSSFALLTETGKDTTQGAILDNRPDNIAGLPYARFLSCIA